MEILVNNLIVRKLVFAGITFTCLTATKVGATDTKIAQSTPAVSSVSKIVINETAKTYIVEPGNLVRSDCFEFRVIVRTKVLQTGCSVIARAVKANATVNDPNTLPPYVTMQGATLSAPGSQIGPQGENLDIAAKSMIDAYVESLQKSGRKTGPGPYDIDMGRYMGRERTTVAGRPAVFYRWGIVLEPGVQALEVGCPKKDEITLSAKWKSFSSVSSKVLMQVAPNRYSGKNGMLDVLAISGMQKDCISPYVNEAISTLKLL
jgi:hypothetical protein